MKSPDTRRIVGIHEAPPKRWRKFAIGDVHEINGVKMRVRKVTNKDIVFRPVA